MDLIDRLKELAGRIPALKDGGLIRTEEGTKNALVMPFLSAMGYDVFNPLEVTPELNADVGTKKGEKVDYAILKDGKPIIIVECKGFGTDLTTNHASQLFRYFSVTPVRFGILTNGVVYRFYSDLVETNKMDSAPFFVFDLSNFNDAGVEILKRFTKSAFDEANNVSVASNLKYRSALKDFVEKLFRDPSDEFLRFCLTDSKVYEGRITQTVLIDFRPLLKEVFRGVINEQVDNRLKSALASTDTTATSEQPKAEDTAPVDETVVADESKIITTQDEIDAYFVVKSILRETLSARRITMRDAQTYCSILLDDNNRKPICRLYFNQAQKRIAIIDENKVENKINISSVDDIYKYADQLIAVVNRYL